MKILRRVKYKGFLTLLTFPLAYGVYRLSIPVGLNYLSDFLDRIPTFAAGLLAGCSLAEGQPLNRKHAAAWTAVAVCGITVAVLRLQGKLYISTCYMVAACVMPFCLLLAKGLDLLGWEWRPLRFLGAYSLEIYLLNVIVTREFAALSPWFDRDGRHIVYYLTVYALNLVLAVLLRQLIEKILRPGFARLRRTQREDG